MTTAKGMQTPLMEKHGLTHEDLIEYVALGKKIFGSSIMVVHLDDNKDHQRHNELAQKVHPMLAEMSQLGPFNTEVQQILSRYW